MKAAKVLKSLESLPPNCSGAATNRDVRTQVLDHPASQDVAESPTVTSDAEYKRAQPHRRWGINE